MPQIVKKCQITTDLKKISNFWNDRRRSTFFWQNQTFLNLEPLEWYESSEHTWARPFLAFTRFPSIDGSTCFIWRLKILSGLVAWVCFDLWRGFASCVRNQNKRKVFQNVFVWNLNQSPENVKFIRFGWIVSWPSSQTCFRS